MDDRTMMYNVDLWPLYPFLPLKRRFPSEFGNSPGEKGRDEGFLYAVESEVGKVKVYFGNLYDVFGDTEGRCKPSDFETQEFKNVDALIVDGWTID